MTEYFTCKACGHSLPAAYQCDAGQGACVLCCRCYPNCEKTDDDEEAPSDCEFCRQANNSLIAILWGAYLGLKIRQQADKGE